MRALITLVVAVIASWFVSYTAEIALGIALHADEELIVAMVLQVVFVVVLGCIFAVVLFAGGRERAVTITAVVVALIGLLGLAGLEAFALTDESLLLAPSDLPLLIEIAAPALLAVFVQWWLVRRHVRRRQAPSAPLAAALN